MKPTELVAKLLANTTNLDVVKELVAEDATYVSLSYNDPDLTAVRPHQPQKFCNKALTINTIQIEPWCGTHEKAGPAAIYQTFIDVSTFWEVLAFDIYAIFGGTDSIETGVHGLEGKEGVNVAVFGRFKYRSRTIGRITDSPFCVWAKVDESKQKVTYMQFMEDTLDTAKSFRKRGTMVYASNPKGGEVVIGDEL